MGSLPVGRSGGREPYRGRWTARVAKSAHGEARRASRWRRRCMVNFCPRCGARLIDRQEGGRERRSCRECAFIHFGEFSIGVGGVVVRDGRALLIRRGQEPRKGWWQIPGGYAEYDEEIEQAVVREVCEESGISADPVGVLGVRNLLGGQLGMTSTNIYVIYLMRYVDGEPRVDGEEITGAGFFSGAELATMDRVQSLSLWSIRVALSGRATLTRVEEGDLRRPGYLLYGLDLGGSEQARRG